MAHSALTRGLPYTTLVALSALVVAAVLFATMGVSVELVALGSTVALVLALLMARHLTTPRLSPTETVLIDPITRIPNRAYVSATLDTLLPRIRRAGVDGIILRIDLANFTSVTQIFGHKVADAMLRALVERISACLRAGDIIARLDGNEFLVVIAPIRIGEEAQARRIITRIRGCFDTPFSEGPEPFQLTYFMGQANAGDLTSVNTEELMSGVEAALDDSRLAGPGTMEVFSPESARKKRDNRRMAAELAKALHEGAIQAYYQPQIDLATGELVGFEALARWIHPQRGVLPPGLFLDVAEATQQTERIGESILADSIRSIRLWDSEGLVVPKVGINFSTAELRSETLVERIKWEVDRADIDPSRIAIEVLETVLVEGEQNPTAANICALASMGFQIELDDFGTGHAAIVNLRRLDVSRIKIDRCFVQQIDLNEELFQLTKSMIRMAESLEIEVLAEGIETEGERATLERLGCNCGQGFGIAMPMPGDETSQWLRDFTPIRAIPDSTPLRQSR